MRGAYEEGVAYLRAVFLRGPGDAEVRAPVCILGDFLDDATLGPEPRTVKETCKPLRLPSSKAND